MSQVTQNDKSAQTKITNLKLHEKFLDSPKFLKALQKVQESHLNSSDPKETENYSPFPKEESLPIFDYGLLEALDSNKSDILENWQPNLEDFESKYKANIEISLSDIKKSDQNSSLPEYSLLAEAEIGYLQQKIQEMMETGDFSISKEVTEGAEFLKRKYLSNQDISAVPHSLNTDSIRSINLNLNNKDHEFDQDAPSCEFTFEYDSTGKLITTSNNIEKQLNSLNNDIKRLKTKLPPISDLNILDNHSFKNNGPKTSEKKSTNNNDKKTNKVKTKSGKGNPKDSDLDWAGCCLFCEYEAVFGEKPVNMIKWYEDKMKKEEERKKEVRRKLDNAKAKALRRNKEMHNKLNHELENEHEPSVPSINKSKITTTTTEDKAQIPKMKPANTPSSKLNKDDSKLNVSKIEMEQGKENIGIKSNAGENDPPVYKD